jgi:hypothetical protein
MSQLGHKATFDCQVADVRNGPKAEVCRLLSQMSTRPPIIEEAAAEWGIQYLRLSERHWQVASDTSLGYSCASRSHRQRC